MSNSIVAHTCLCAEPELGVVSHGAVYCSGCDGFIADVDDVVISSENTNVVKRLDRAFDPRVCKVCGAVHNSNELGCDESDNYAQD